MILIIDAMPLVYQTWATVGHFSTKSGISSGLRYGFIRSVRSWANKFKAEKVVICWDVQGPVLKAAGFELTYKANRQMTPDKQKMYDQIPDLKVMLAKTKYSQIEAKGYEADDLCATVARYYQKEQGKESVIATPDFDVQSAIDEMTSVFYTGRPEKRLWTLPQFTAHYGFHPSRVPVFKALFGDKSDAVEGAVKETVASTEAFCSLATIYPGFRSVEFFDVFFKTWVVAPQSQELARRTLALVELVDVPRDSWVVQKGQRDTEGLTELFKTLEFASLMKFIPDFVGQ